MKRNLIKATFLGVALMAAVCALPKTNTPVVPSTNTAAAATNTPIKLQSKPAVYIIPRVVVVETPQATLMWCDEFHIKELAKLGFRAYAITNWTVHAP